MEEDIDCQIHKLRRRIVELEVRLAQPEQWAAGEIEIYKQQVKLMRLKLKAIIEEMN